VSRDPTHEEEIESRWEAAPAVALVIASQLVLALVSRAEDWTIWGLPWWVWLAPVGPELALLIPLAWHRPRHKLEQIGHRRTVALALLAVISLANALLLVAVIASLVKGDEKSGGQLLFKALTVWGTNVIAFGLWYWGFDRGGPVRRLRPDAPPADFQFPQMENPQLAEPGWYPRLRLHLRLVHELDRFQPNRRDAFDAAGEAVDADRVSHLGYHDPARCRARGQHLQVARRVRPRAELWQSSLPTAAHAPAAGGLPP